MCGKTEEIQTTMAVKNQHIETKNILQTFEKPRQLSFDLVGANQIAYGGVRDSRGWANCRKEIEIWCNNQSVALSASGESEKIAQNPTASEWEDGSKQARSSLVLEIEVDKTDLPELCDGPG